MSVGPEPECSLQGGPGLRFSPVHGHARVSLPSPGWTRTRVVTDSICAQRLEPGWGHLSTWTLSAQPPTPTPLGVELAAPSPDPSALSPQDAGSGDACVCRSSLVSFLSPQEASGSQVRGLGDGLQDGGVPGGKAALPDSLDAAPTARTVTPDSRHLRYRGLWAGLGGSFGEREA